MAVTRIRNIHTSLWGLRMIFFSAENMGFYSKVTGAEVFIPEDAVEISEERWRELLNGQSSGQYIVAGEGGNPELASVPPSNS